MTTTFQIKDMIITRDNVNKLVDDKQVRLVDSNSNGLELFSYINWGEHSDKDVDKCRGVIFKDNSLVLRSYPSTKEIIPNDFGIVETDLLKYPEKCTFFNAHEGAMIRVFYNDDKWYISTNKKLDAFTSKWASKDSFGYSFLQALENEILENSNFEERCKSDFSKSKRSKSF